LAKIDKVPELGNICFAIKKRGVCVAFSPEPLMIENMKLKLTTKSQIVIRQAPIWSTVELSLLKITRSCPYSGKPNVVCCASRHLLWL